MKKISIILTIFTLMACNSTSIFCGKYINKKDENIINYLIINKDYSYYHYYKNDTIILTQKGKWSVDKNNIDMINFFDFKNYNEEGTKYKKFEIYFLIKSDKYINPGFDGNVNGSFVKE